MALFNRKSKEPLKEGNGQAQNYEIAGLESYNFIRGLRLIASDTYNTDYVLDRMMDDAIISAAVDMYIDDTLQVDPQKNEIFWVDVDSTDDRFEKNLAKGLTDELNRFLKSDLRMDKELREILRTNSNLIFDIVKPFSFKGTDQELADLVKTAIHNRCNDVFCVITVDQPFVK